MNSRKLAIEKTIKYVLLCLMVFVLYILQGTPGFLSVFGIRPVFLIPFYIILAMLEEENYAIIVYVMAGLLFELSAGRIVGLYTIPLIIACMICMIMVKFIFQPNYRNSMAMCFISTFIILSLDFFFNYILPGHRGIFIIFIKTVLLTSIYSTLFSVLYFKIIVAVQNRFKKYNER